MPELSSVASDETPELDVRDVPKPQRHPLIFARFAALLPTASFVLVNNHDPKHLRQEFDRDHPGSYDWHYLETGPVWRIRISRLLDADLPRVLGRAPTLLSTGLSADPAGAIWALDVSQRQLDANIVHLRPDTQIESHVGPDLDVLMYVVDGDGELVTDAGTVPLDSGTLLWLPRRSRRSITASSAGLSYLTVHSRRPALRIEQRRP